MSVLATIPVTNHRTLFQPLIGRIFATHHHGPDVEVVLEDRKSFSLLLDEARQLVFAIGPNLHDLIVVYDGHCVVVGREE